MRDRNLLASALRQLGALFLVVSVQAALAQEQEVVALPPTLFRVLIAAGSGLEEAVALRGVLRTLLVNGPPVARGGTAWDADCEDANRDSNGTAGLIRLALADGSWLVQATCAQGAYQGSFWAAQLWIADTGQGVGALLRWPIAAEHLGAPANFELSEQVVVWGDLTVLAPPHSTRAELEILNRFRAPGDCGTRTRYALERGALRVVGLAAVFTCPESLGVSGPADWRALPTSDR